MSYGDYPNLDAVERVLVVKLRHHGDVLLTSPVFRVLRRALPEARIDAYIYREMLPMLEGHPDVAGFQLYDASRKLGSVGPLVAHEMDLFRRIRSEGYDLVINLTEGDRGALIAWFSGARYRIGWDPEGAGLPLKRKLYTHLVKRCRTPRHMVEQNLDALRRIGIFPAQEERDLLFMVPADAEASARERLRAAGLTPGAYILIHPTSRWLFKSWPAARVAELIRSLDARGGPLVLSSPPPPPHPPRPAHAKGARGRDRGEPLSGLHGFGADAHRERAHTSRRGAVRSLVGAGLGAVAKPARAGGRPGLLLSAVRPGRLWREQGERLPPFDPRRDGVGAGA